MTHYDITIIGAGPAGATLARTLQHKYKVLLVDKRPLDKAPSKLIKNCGGLIAPDAQKALAGFGLSIPKEVLVSPQMFSVKTLDMDNGISRTYQRHYLNVDRQRYDRWLVSLCNNEVDRAFSTRYRGATKTDDGYVISLLSAGEKYQVSTDIIVGADGASSKVKKDLLGKQAHEPKRYISIQEWFPNETNLNQFVAIFDKEISDFYSWIIPKDDGVIFGSAVEEGRDATRYHNIQKEKLNKLGYGLKNPSKKEGCHLLRPASSKCITTGENQVALIGEAAGFISPTSAEGISYAMLSADALGRALLEQGREFMSAYNRYAKPLRQNIDGKMLKAPFMYHPTLRKLILLSNIGTIKCKKGTKCTQMKI